MLRDYSAITGALSVVPRLNSDLLLYYLPDLESSIDMKLPRIRKWENIDDNEMLGCTWEGPARR